MIAAILGLGSTIFSGLFGMKKKQGEVVQSALKTFESVQATDAAYFAASAEAINAVYTKGGWLERGFRPTLMWVAMTLIVARFFGFEPAGMTPVELEHMYTFLYIGLSGYVPLRSVDKMMQGFQVGSILKKFVEKKVV